MVQTLIGLESEYLLQTHTIGDLGDARGISPEFFRFMIEAVTDPFSCPEEAVISLRKIVEPLAHRFGLERYAAFPGTVRDTSFGAVTNNTPYYRWVYDQVRDASNLHFVGIHLNVSWEGANPDAYVRVCNALRILNFLFVLVTANSPFRDGRPAGAHSIRNVRFPNRYDVPFWTDEAHFYHWLRYEKERGLIYPDRHRCWMPVCPRLDDEGRISRLEIRGLDGGLGVSWGLIEGCVELALRIFERHADVRRPLSVWDLLWNDRQAAVFGREAVVRWNRKEVPILKVARDWCRGITALEEVLSEGSPAERAVRAFRETGRIPP